MKINLLHLLALGLILAAIFVSATIFNPGGDIDMKNRYNFLNGGNFSGQGIAITSAPAACPAGYFITFYNGTTAICTAGSSIGGTINTSDLISRNPIVDVRSYGVYGNDTLDDSIKMDAMLAGYASGSVTFFFPCGTYLLNSTWTLGTNQDYIEVYGSGQCSIIKQDNGAKVHLIKLNSADNFNMHDITLDGNYQNNAKDLDCINTGLYSNDLVFNNVIIKNCGGNAIDLIQTSRARVTNSYFNNLGNSSCTTSSMCSAVNMAGSNNIVVSGNYVDGFYGDGGFFVASNAGVYSTDIDITGNIIKNAHGDQGAGVTIYTGERVTVTGNQMNTFDNTSHGINGVFMANTGNNNHIVVSGNYMNITGVGVETNNVQFASITGNVIEGSGTGSDANGIYSSGDYVTISGNVINNMWSHGIYLTGTHTDHIISGNIIKNTRNAGSGIRLVVTSPANFSNLIITENIINNNAGYGVYLSGGGSLPGLKMQNNIIYSNTLGQTSGLPQINYYLNETQPTINAASCPYLYINTTGSLRFVGCAGTNTSLAYP